jgi:hypothetical protein
MLCIECGNYCQSSHPILDDNHENIIGYYCRLCYPPNQLRKTLYQRERGLQYSNTEKGKKMLNINSLIRYHKRKGNVDRVNELLKQKEELNKTN